MRLIQGLKEVTGTWQEANARCKGYDNFNDYYQYSPRDIDIARMTWVADNLSI